MKSSLRISAGNLKNRKLFVPKNGIEPTKSIVKNALFNIIGDEVIESRWLDLFAGCGNIGIEAISRGANQVVFVENNPINIKVIKKNLLLFNINSVVCCYDAMQYIEKIDDCKNYDFIFLDPPYNYENINIFLQKLTSKLFHHVTIIVEHHNKQKIEKVLNNNISIIKQKRYGQTCLTFISQLIQVQ